jgi:hypothetical protein
LLALGGWWWIAGVHAQAPEREPEQETGPDLEFLEYLGAWAEDDDEWLASEEWQKDAPKDGDERRPEKQKDEDDESE